MNSGDAVGGQRRLVGSETLLERQNKCIAQGARPATTILWQLGPVHVLLRFARTKRDPAAIAMTARLRGLKYQENRIFEVV